MQKARFGVLFANINMSLEAFYSPGRSALPGACSIHLVSTDAAGAPLVYLEMPGSVYFRCPLAKQDQ